MDENLKNDVVGRNFTVKFRNKKGEVMELTGNVSVYAWDWFTMYVPKRGLYTVVLDRVIGMVRDDGEVWIDEKKAGNEN